MNILYSFEKNMKILFSLQIMDNAFRQDVRILNILFPQVSSLVSLIYTLEWA